MTGCFTPQVCIAPGLTVVPSHVRQQTWQASKTVMEMLNSIAAAGVQMWESRSDFQVSRSLPDDICTPVRQRVGTAITIGARYGWSFASTVQELQAILWPMQLLPYGPAFVSKIAPASKLRPGVCF